METAFKLEDRKHEKRLKKIFKPIFLIGCIFITTSIGSYFFHREIIHNKIKKV